jgi:hypothetical protein
MTEYRAVLDTVIEGRPTAEGALIRGLSDDKAKAYIGAGLIEEIKPEADEKAKSKDEKKADEAFAEAAKKIDTSADKRTEK